MLSSNIPAISETTTGNPGGIERYRGVCKELHFQILRDWSWSQQVRGERQAVSLVDVRSNLGRRITRAMAWPSQIARDRLQAGEIDDRALDNRVAVA